MTVPRSMEAAWPRLRLTVQAATKLNRGHLANVGVAFLLPCLGRIEVDEQAGGPQAVTCEDTMTKIRPSRGRVPPAGPDLRSEPAIVAGIAEATLSPNPRVPWGERFLSLRLSPTLSMAAATPGTAPWSRVAPPP